MAIAQNGTGTPAVIVGGTASSGAATGSTATVAAPGSAATSVANSGSLNTGTGSLDSTGACQCSCLCGAASFPNAAIQGVGAFGGTSGKLLSHCPRMPEFNFNSKILGAMPLNALMTT